LFFRAGELIINWICFFQTKITLKIDSEAAVKELESIAVAKGLAAAVIRDAGEENFSKTIENFLRKNGRMRMGLIRTISLLHLKRHRKCLLFEFFQWQ
jgi:hypothetical protein